MMVIKIHPPWRVEIKKKKKKKKKRMGLTLPFGFYPSN